MSSEPTRDYSVFGLVVRSDLPLPELFPHEAQGAADVTIHAGEVPEAVHAPEGLSAGDDALLLVIPGVARYRIADGRSITVQAEVDVPATVARNHTPPLSGGGSVSRPFGCTADWSRKAALMRQLPPSWSPRRSSDP